MENVIIKEINDARIKLLQRENEIKKTAEILKITNSPYLKH